MVRHTHTTAEPICLARSVLQRRGEQLNGFRLQPLCLPLPLPLSQHIALKINPAEESKTAHPVTGSFIQLNKFCV